jgi:molecular chaperone GrpE (heat shock protein)
LGTSADAGDVGSAAAPAAVPDVPPTETAEHPTDALAGTLERQTAELGLLRAQVEAFHERSRAHEDVISRMQARIEDLQADQVRALLGPVATELATLHGELAEIAGRDPGSMTVERVTKEVGLLVHRVESGLELLGMQTVAAAPGVAFDRRWHSAIRRVPTGEPDLDQTIASVVRQGFGAEGATRASVMARVAVYQYDPDLGSPGDGARPAAPSPLADPPPAGSGRPEEASPPPQPSPDIPLPPIPPGYHES